MQVLPGKKFDFIKQERKILLIFIFSILVYTGFVFFADAKKISLVFSRFDWRILPLLFFLSFSNYIIRFFRWHYFLKKINIPLPLGKSFRIFLSGISMTVTPGKTGEIVKAYLIKKENGNGYSELVPLIFTERFTDGLGMLVLALGGIFLFNNSVVTFSFFFLTFLMLFFIFYGKKTVVRVSTFLDNRFKRFKILDFFLNSLKNMEILFSSKTLVIATLISILAWSLEGLSLYILVQSFSPTLFVNGLLYSLFIFSFASIAGFLVLIPGGIGVAEVSISSLLNLFFGLSVAQAVFITLVFRFVTLWFGVLIGLISLFFSLSKLPEEDSERL